MNFIGDPGITINPGLIKLDTFEIHHSICEGENYKGSTESGTYIENLLSINGCDSIVKTVLIVIPVHNKVDSIIICRGERYKGHTEPGTYIENLKSMNGCDSIVTTILAFLQYKKYENQLNNNSYVSSSMLSLFITLIILIGGIILIVYLLSSI